MPVELHTGGVVVPAGQHSIDCSQNWKLMLVNRKIQSLGYDDMLDTVINELAGQVMERLQHVGCCDRECIHIIFSDVNKDDIWLKPQHAFHIMKYPSRFLSLS
jgi:hypothetical protein